jgi:predicted DNA-binding protein with PD1-like motif
MIWLPQPELLGLLAVTQTLTQSGDDIIKDLSSCCANAYLPGIILAATCAMLSGGSLEKKWVSVTEVSKELEVLSCTD